MSSGSVLLRTPALALLLAAAGAQARAAEIISVSTDRATVAAGETLIVTFTTSGTFELGNDFLVQLSGSSGSFTAPTPLPALQTGEKMLEVRVPCDMQTGGAYRVRLLSTSPRDTAVAPTSLAVTGRPAPAIVAGRTSLCEGESTTLDAGAGFSSYSWSSGQTTRTITVTAAGRYQVTATDGGGCALTSAPVDITVNPRPMPTIAQIGNVLEAPEGFASYRWSTGEAGRRLTLQRSGTYTVTVTDANGCDGTSAPFNAMFSSVATADAPGERGTLAIASDGDAVIVRGPARAGEELILTIVDAAGRIVERRRIAGDRGADVRVPVASYPTGFYLVSVEMGDLRRVESLVLGR